MLSMFNPYYEYFSMHPPHFPLTIDPVQESFELCSPPWIIDRLHRWFKVYRKPFCNISFLPLKNQRKSWPYCFDLLLMIFQLKLTLKFMKFWSSLKFTQTHDGFDISIAWNICCKERWDSLMLLLIDHL